MSPGSAPSANAALEWDSVAAPIPGENVIGDRALVMFARDYALAAAIDGVGHGAEAAAAAQVAAYTLQHTASQDLASIVRECHQALSQTRGAAVSLARIDYRADALSWLGIGNVEARLVRGRDPFRATESMLLHGGIVGHALPPLAPQTTPVARGDLLIFATDGIRRNFTDSLAPTGSCRDIAERILQECALGSDDALVLVGRYLGQV